MFNAKTTELSMLLDIIKNMVEVQNLLLYYLNIRNGSKGLVHVTIQDALPCAHSLRLQHVEIDRLVIVVQGQGMYRQGPNTQLGSSQQVKPNYLSTYLNYYNNQGYHNIPSHLPDLGGILSRHILFIVMVSISNKFHSHN